jgi:hypothetical protein
MFASLRSQLRASVLSIFCIDDPISLAGAKADATVRASGARCSSSFACREPHASGTEQDGTLAPARIDSHQANFHLTPPHSARTQMRVTKRNGR